MSKEYQEVDFLIVTALPVETEAVKQMLEARESFAHDILGKISRLGTTASYDIALIEIGDMGTNAAQQLTREALTRRNPRRVILTGIAAGFPESEVKLGDILIPYAIVPYELAKLKEKTAQSAKTSWHCLFDVFKTNPNTEKVDYEHRGLATRVSYSLWHAADTLGKDSSSKWWQTMKQDRPDKATLNPTVHSKSRSILGSGEKVVATELAEARRWLIREYHSQALGLEMESYGVFMACCVTDTPFLVIKASQDPATNLKDTTQEKDVWRTYAAEASAAFTVSLIKRFELEYDALIIEHMKSVKEVVRVFERDLPKPLFTYKVSRAQTYSQLKMGAYDLPHQDTSVLIPNDALPAIALHGGGGTGKTRIIHSLLNQVIDKGNIPLMLDLRKYSREHDQSIKGVDNGNLIVDLILTASVPRRTTREIERLAKEGRLVVMIDGLNEVTREVRSALVDYMRALHRNGTCYILVTDRFGAGDYLETFHHAVVDRLDPEEVRTLFNGVFGAGTYERLNAHSQKVFCRPFFLSLALKTRNTFTGVRIWSNIFQEFFTNQLYINEEKLNDISKTTFISFGKEGIFNLVKFKQIIGPEVYQTLIGAEVLGKDDTGFEHDLWRDYLVSRHISHTPTDWKDYVFDMITTFAYSLESISLTIEQLVSKETKDTFLKTVFDWNYIAAADCIAGLREDDPGPRQVSIGIRTAILSAIVEKRFDTVQRTRLRSKEICREHSYEFAKPFVDSKSFEDLQKYVTTIADNEDWFKIWKILFTAPSGTVLTAEQVELIKSEDSMIGWACANLARRGVLDETLQKRLREIYDEYKPDAQKSVRWRVTHVLGAYPGASNVVMLLNALQQDTYHWVQYGAARSLIEIAASSEGELRGQVINGLTKFVSEYNTTRVWVRRQIFQEIIEASFVRSPKPGWKDVIMPVLLLILGKENDPTNQLILKERIDKLKNYDENE